MSSPALDTSNFSLVASENVMHNVADSEEFANHARGDNALLTARAVLAVTVLGAGFWFMLWKIALHIWITR